LVNPIEHVADTPLWAEEAAKILVGTALDAASVKKAVTAAEAITSPASDSRGPARYRTKMAGVMLARALARAKERAGDRTGDAPQGRSLWQSLRFR
jgi:carbon-monoxide dehydrogenase medium subunit